MNFELGRFVGSTDVSPFIGSGEQGGETKSACSSSLTLVLVGLAKRRLPLSFSPPRVDFTISRQTNTATEVLPQSPHVRRGFTVLIEVAGSFRLRKLFFCPPFLTNV